MFSRVVTAQKMKKSFMENFIFCEACRKRTSRWIGLTGISSQAAKFVLEVNPFQASVLFHIETSRLFYSTN